MTSYAWDFTPEQASNPGKLTCHLIEGCLAYPNENQQLLALYWGLACAYRATVQYYQRTVVKAGTQTSSENALTETMVQTTSENMIVEIGIQTASGDTMVEIGTQTTTTVTAPVVKKKQWTRRSMGPYHRLVREEEEGFDQEAGPSAKKWEEGVREIRQEAETTWSMTSSELRDMQKDYSRQRGEQIAAWLLRCWHSGANSQQLEAPFKCEGRVSIQGRCYELPRKVDYRRRRHPVPERELVVLEVIYSDLDNDEVSKDPDYILCTRAMWRKVIQSAPTSYSNRLATMCCPDTPTVERTCSWLQNFEENLCPSLSLRASALAVRGALRSQSPPAPVRGKREPEVRAMWCALVLPA
ncbi:hypothetical protein QYF61_012578 [Mycteria americana]|uniref:Uncharacterized protein n=1 Tax=Mycteria americana TaxID=33587 RepID=A0AAN7MZR3_MYCAM|nr:hypothetical protein QYF61_012578 [Mycteria americana]